MANDWEILAERLAIIGCYGLSRMCYRIAEFFGRWGMNFEHAYREKVSP